MTKASQVGLFLGVLLLGAFAKADGDAIVAGTGKAKLGLLLQNWYVNDATATEPFDTFKIRRAEIKLSGSVVENTRWFVMIDPAKSLSSGAVDTKNDNKILQDLGVAFTVFPDFEIVAGQFKIPASWEGNASSSELLFPERSMLARGFGDRRDQGMQINYKFLDNMKLILMASNGMNANSKSTNVDEANTSKDGNGRLEAGLMENDLKLGIWGGSLMYGTFGATKTRTQNGVDIRYTKERLLVGLDYATAKDNDIEATAMVADLGYMLSETFQVVLRYDTMTTKTTPESVAKATALGVNYLLAKHNAKIQLAYTSLEDCTGGKGSYGTYSKDKKGGLTIVNFQAAL